MLEFRTTHRTLAQQSGSMALIKDPENHSHTKHIDVQYHCIREVVEDGLIQISYVPTSQMAADILTKLSTKAIFQCSIALLGLFSFLYSPFSLFPLPLLYFFHFIYSSVSRHVLSLCSHVFVIFGQSCYFETLISGRFLTPSIPSKRCEDMKVSGYQGVKALQTYSSSSLQFPELCFGKIRTRLTTWNWPRKSTRSTRNYQAIQKRN